MKEKLFKWKIAAVVIAILIVIPACLLMFSGCGELPDEPVPVPDETLKHLNAAYSQIKNPTVEITDMYNRLVKKFPLIGNIDVKEDLIEDFKTSAKFLLAGKDATIVLEGIKAKLTVELEKEKQIGLEKDLQLEKNAEERADLIGKLHAQKQVTKRLEEIAAELSVRVENYKKEMAPYIRFGELNIAIQFIDIVNIPSDEINTVIHLDSEKSVDENGVLIDSKSHIEYSQNLLTEFCNEIYTNNYLGLPENILDGMISGYNEIICAAKERYDYLVILRDKVQLAIGRLPHDPDATDMLNEEQHRHFESIPGLLEAFKEENGLNNFNMIAQYDFYIKHFDRLKELNENYLKTV